MFSDNEPSPLSAHLSFSVINVKEDSFLMVRITHIPGTFLPRNNLHLLSSVCLCGLFHTGVIYGSSISLALISHSSGRDVDFFLSPHVWSGGNWNCVWHHTVLAPALPVSSHTLHRYVSIFSWSPHYLFGFWMWFMHASFWMKVQMHTLRFIGGRTNTLHNTPY